jgi:hypothetical protein
MERYNIAEKVYHSSPISQSAHLPFFRAFGNGLPASFLAHGSLAFPLHLHLVLETRGGHLSQTILGLIWRWPLSVDLD